MATARSTGLGTRLPWRSRPRDYVRFERALLRGGELDGERILRSEIRNAMRHVER